METNTINKVKPEEVTKEQFALMVVGAADGVEEDKKIKLKAVVNKVADLFDDCREKAVKLLEDAEGLDRFLERVAEKFNKLGTPGKKLAYVPEMIMIVRSYVIKEYTEISLAEIIAIIAALIYFVSPLEVFPDGIPGLGFLDDALVVAVVIGWCDEDIDKYMEWRKNR